MTVLTLFDNLPKRRCKCGCGKSLEDYHGKREIHPECEKNHDKERRKKRKEEKRNERTQEIWDAAAEYDRQHPEFRKHLENIALGKIWDKNGKISFRLCWEKTRARLQAKVNNNYQRWFRLKLEENPDLKGKFRIRT